MLDEHMFSLIINSFLMIDLGLTPYLKPFDLTPKQIQRITRLLKSRLRWWGFDDTDLALRVAIIAAPGRLSKLTPEAIELLKRCQDRVWAFQRDVNERFGISRRTYGQLFGQLTTLGLIIEGDVRQKLKGSKNIPQLKTLLQDRGLPTKGTKDVLLDRLVENLGQGDLSNLVADVTLFTATETGEEALRILNDLSIRLGGAIRVAIMENKPQIDAQLPPMPEKLPAEMREVYTEEEWEEIRALPNRSQEEALSAPAARHAHPQGPGLPMPGWYRLERKQMTADERRAAYVDALVAVTNLDTPSFVTLSDRADSDRYVQFTEAYFEAAGGYWQQERPLSSEQKRALLEAGLQEAADTRNYWVHYGERSLEEMVQLIEECFAILGVWPDFGLQVEFDTGAPG